MAYIGRDQPRQHLALAAEAAGDPADARATAWPPVFLHCGWRTRGTWIWNRFRGLDGVTAYYEPLAEQLATVRPATLPRLNASNWASGHAGVDRPYFEEFRPFLNPLQPGVPGYRRGFATEDFFAGPDAELPELEAWLRGLIRSARAQGRQPVLKFCRSLGRAGWMRRRFADAVHIAVLRDPFTQFASALTQYGQHGVAYFLAMPLLLLARERHHPEIAACLYHLGARLPEPEDTPTEAGAFRTGALRTGTFRSGAFRTGAFRTDTFRTGTFRSGAFDRGSFDRGAIERGAIERRAFDKGTIEKGAFNTGAIEKGATDRGAFEAGTCQTGTFQTGTFQTGTFQPGTFETGTFQAGTFEAGAFEAGALEAYLRRGDPAAWYRGFLAFWAITAARAVAAADLVIDSDALARDAAYRRRMEDTLRRLTGRTVRFDDVSGAPGWEMPPSLLRTSDVLDAHAGAEAFLAELFGARWADMSGLAAGVPPGGSPPGGSPPGRSPPGGSPPGGLPAGGSPAGGLPSGGSPSGGSPSGGSPPGGSPAGGSPSGRSRAGGREDGEPAGGPGYLARKLAEARSRAFAAGIANPEPVPRAGGAPRQEQAQEQDQKQDQEPDARTAMLEAMARAARAERDLAAMRASTCWRVTAPLRWVSRQWAALCGQPGNSHQISVAVVRGKTRRRLGRAGLSPVGGRNASAWPPRA